MVLAVIVVQGNLMGPLSAGLDAYTFTYCHCLQLFARRCLWRRMLLPFYARMGSRLEFGIAFGIAFGILVAADGRRLSRRGGTTSRCGSEHLGLSVNQ